MKIEELVALIRRVADDINIDNGKTLEECVLPFKEAGIKPDMWVGINAESGINPEILVLMRLQWFAGQALSIIASGETGESLLEWLSMVDSVLQQSI